MAKEKNNDAEPAKPCHVLVKLDPELRKAFKRWSYRNGVSMTCGIVSLMETVTTSGKKYTISKRVKQVIEGK